MADEGSSAGLYILVAFLIILVVGALLYFGGVFNTKKEVDVNIKTPGVVLYLAK